VAALLGGRHRHRHQPRQPGQHLLRLPAGRRHHQPPLWRHRAGAGHLPGSRLQARRRGDRAERAGQGQHLQPAPAARPAGRDVLQGALPGGHRAAGDRSAGRRAHRDGRQRHPAGPRRPRTRGPARAQGARRRRRPPQRVRPHRRARDARHAGGAGGRRPDGHRRAGGGRHRPGADGRDDAADGRLRDDPRDPPDAPVRAAPRHHRHRPRHAGRPREEHRRRRQRLHHQADRRRGTAQLHGALAGVTGPAQARNCCSRSKRILSRKGPGRWRRESPTAPGE